jgi:hypothetical protein
METPEIKPTNLNMLFIDCLPNFAHLVTTEPQTKDEFIKTLLKTYDCTNNAKNNLFMQSIQKSIFDTIRLNRNKDSILFNQ